MKKQQGSPVSCPQCSDQFKSAQGLAGHKRFRHADSERDAEITRSQGQKLESLQAFADDPDLTPGTAVLIARLNRKYGARKGKRSDTNCLVCSAVCRTPQGLSGHMRHQHGARAGTTTATAAEDLRKTGDLLRYIRATSLPEPVLEAIWEKVLRLSGFRW